MKSRSPSPRPPTPKRLDVELKQGLGQRSTEEQRNGLAGRQPASTSRRRRNREATELALVEAACVEFSDRGYDAATTKCIADRAGCSEGLIQNYFGGKHGLLMAVVDSVWLPRADAQKMFSDPPCAVFADEIRMIFQAVAGSILSVRRELKIIYHRALTDLQFAELLSSIHPRNTIKHVLAQRLADNWRLAVAPDIAAEMILATVFALSFVYPNMLRWSDSELETLGQGFIGIVVRGLSETGPAGDPAIQKKVPPSAPRSRPGPRAKKAAPATARGSGQ